MERCSHGNLTIRAMLTLVECSACSMITHFDYTKFTPGDGYMECLKMQCFEMGTNILTEIWGEFDQILAYSGAYLRGVLGRYAERGHEKDGGEAIRRALAAGGVHDARFHSAAALLDLARTTCREATGPGRMGAAPCTIMITSNSRHRLSGQTSQLTAGRLLPHAANHPRHG